MVAEENGLVVLTGADVNEILQGQREKVVRVIEAAYLAYGRGETSSSESVFLRFKNRPADRIIGLPASLGAPWDVAGLKWIASMPGNIASGKDRASAVLILNDLTTGHPRALLESSVISAWRTAASAALAARAIHTGSAPSVGVIGCGLIAYETLAFLKTIYPSLQQIHTFDARDENAKFFLGRAREVLSIAGEVARDTREVLAESDITILATTATEPHISAIPTATRSRTILHLSLRDLGPDCLLDADNTADDVVHVNQARTSVQLCAEQCGHSRFMRASLPEILAGQAAGRTDGASTAIFHPFGMGILDLALGHFVKEQAQRQGKGTQVPEFLPRPWRGEKSI